MMWALQRSKQKYLRCEMKYEIGDFVLVNTLDLLVFNCPGNYVVHSCTLSTPFMMLLNRHEVYLCSMKTRSNFLFVSQGASTDNGHVGSIVIDFDSLLVKIFVVCKVIRLPLNQYQRVLGLHRPSMHDAQCIHWRVYETLFKARINWYLRWFHSCLSGWISPHLLSNDSDRDLQWTGARNLGHSELAKLLCKGPTGRASRVIKTSRKS